MQEQKFTGCPPIDSPRLKYYGDEAVDALRRSAPYMNGSDRAPHHNDWAFSYDLTVLF